MYVTIDTSALIAVIGNEDEKGKIIKATEGYSLYAPISVHWEIGNAFSAMFKRRKLTIEQAQQALEAYREIPIKFVDVALEQTLIICNKLNIYAYDAYLLQCALITNTSLLTLDRRLSVKAEELGIKRLEIK